MSFKVTKIIDGNSFEISPSWKWKEITGTLIRASGYNAPEQNQSGYETALSKLKDLILDKQVELANPIRITSGLLLCDVLLDNVNLKEHFPEYQQKTS